MLRPLVVLLVMFLVRVAIAQQLPEPTLIHSPMPKYPDIAKKARIEGSVKLEFVVTESGEAVGVRVLSGHPLLNPYAAEAVRQWRFSVPFELRSKDPFHPSNLRYQTEFVYRMSGKEVDPNPMLTVCLATFHQVVIVSDALKGPIHVGPKAPTTAEKSVYTHNSDDVR